MVNIKPGSVFKLNKQEAIVEDQEAAYAAFFIIDFGK